MRVLITGSRDWGDPDTIRHELDSLIDEHGLDVVVGDCPTGADADARDWVRDNQRQGVRVYMFRADWRQHGRSAGPTRNQAMVDSGADLCLAFFQPGAANRGTAHCARLAARAGIEVRRYLPDPPARTERGREAIGRLAKVMQERRECASGTLPAPEGQDHQHGRRDHTDRGHSQEPPNVQAPAQHPQADRAYASAHGEQPVLGRIGHRRRVQPPGQ